MIETVHTPSMDNHSERKENTMEGNMILKLGAEVTKHAYQNRQFREISAQNQRLTEMVHQYRMLNYTEHFYTGMTLLDEALRSQNEAVFRQNLHSANEHFTQVLCMERPEGINNEQYSSMIVASHWGKFQYYAAHDDLPNMMHEFFSCGSSLPQDTLDQFGKALPQLYVNEGFLECLKGEAWDQHLVNRYHHCQAEHLHEEGLHVLQQELDEMRRGIMSRCHADSCCDDLKKLAIHR